MPDGLNCRPVAEAALKPLSARPRVLLADNLRLWLERISSLLRHEFELVGVVNDGAALVGESLMHGIIITGNPICEKAHHCGRTQVRSPLKEIGLPGLDVKSHAEEQGYRQQLANQDDPGR